MARFIRCVDGALSATFCENLIQRFEAAGSARRTGETGNGIDLEKKRSLDITLDRHPSWHDARNQIIAQVSTHLIAYAADFPHLLVGAMSPIVRHPKTGEPVTLTAKNFSEIGGTYVAPLVSRMYRPGTINLQKYECGVGGYPHWHSEIFPRPGDNDPLHRVLFWICYLNDVADGGETEFAYQSVKVHPKAGRLLIAPAGFTHTHRGNIPLSGDKYVLASWVLYQPGEAFAVHGHA